MVSGHIDTTVIRLLDGTLSLAIIASEQKIVDVGAAAGHSADDAIRAAEGCGASVRPVHA
jgi:hypothetical protein